MLLLMNQLLLFVGVFCVKVVGVVTRLVEMRVKVSRVFFIGEIFIFVCGQGVGIVVWLLGSVLLSNVLDLDEVWLERFNINEFSINLELRKGVV